MTDIVERLRTQGVPEPIKHEAADEIERLTAEASHWMDEAARLQNMKANLHGHIKRLEDENTKLRKEARNEALEEAAKYIESRAYRDGMVDEPADELAAAIRAMQSIPQNSSPAQSDGSSGSHNAHAPDEPDS